MKISKNIFQAQKKLSKIWFKIPIALWAIQSGIKYKILFYISKIKYLCQRHTYLKYCTTLAIQSIFSTLLWLKKRERKINLLESVFYTLTHTYTYKNIYSLLRIFFLSRSFKNANMRISHMARISDRRRCTSRASEFVQSHADLNSLTPVSFCQDTKRNKLLNINYSLSINRDKISRSLSEYVD